MPLPGDTYDEDYVTGEVTPTKIDYEFSVKKRKPKEVLFSIGGSTSEGEPDNFRYHFTTPKRSIMVEKILTGEAMDDTDAMAGAINWLGQGLREGEGDRILARLQDPDDDLDLPDLFAIVQSLAGGQADRPTMSRRGLSS